MKQIDTYINEKLVINKNTKVYKYHPQDKDELGLIIKDRLKKDPNADLNDIDVSEITDMSSLFYSLDPHKINISEWDMSNVENVEEMFMLCKNLECDLSKWDISNLKKAFGMFYGCKNFDSDLSKWNPIKLKKSYMLYMFGGCDTLEKNNHIPDWYERPE